LAPYATPGERIGHALLRLLCLATLIFLIVPIIVVIPLSFNSVPYFTYPMSGFSLRWYEEVINGDAWRRALQNSLIVGFSSMLLATILGTLAALGLTRMNFSGKGLLMALLILPMAVPSVIVGVSLFYFFASFGLTSSLSGMILAHTVLGLPFVVLTVSATLVGLDKNILLAATGLGAGRFRVFFQITLPLIFPGVLSGAIFAFATSWDEIVVVLLIAGVEQHTLPLRMWVGVRDSISPSILAVATLLTLVAVALMFVLELLRRRSARLSAVRHH
jgi:putative spermidine/putrescine transport system permease protein